MGKGGKYKVQQIIDEKQDQHRGGVASPLVRNDGQAKTWSMSEKDFHFLMGIIETLSSQYSEINSKISEVTKFQEKLSESFGDISKRVSVLEENVESIVERGKNCDGIQAQIAEVAKECSVLNHAMDNDRIIIRNLPVEIHRNQMKMNSIVKKILSTLKTDINDTQFETFSEHHREEKSANIVVKFSSAMLKTQVVRKYRAVRKELDINDSPFKVEKLVDLAPNHHLHGKTVSITNKLSKKNTELIHHARKFVGSYFDFVYDSPEGSIIIKNKDKFHQIKHEEDIAELIKGIQFKKISEGIHHLVEKFNSSKFFNSFA
jgi:hypothetical protein